MPGLFRFGTLRQQPQRWPECKDRCESSKRYQKHMKTQVSGISGSPACCGGATFGRSSNSRTETPGSSIASGGNYFVIPGRSWKPHTHTHTHTLPPGTTASSASLKTTTSTSSGSRVRMLACSVLHLSFAVATVSTHIRRSPATDITSAPRP